MGKHVPVHAETPRVITTFEDPVPRPFEARVGDTRVGLGPDVWTGYASRYLCESTVPQNPPRRSVVARASGSGRACRGWRACPPREASVRSI